MVDNLVPSKFEGAPIYTEYFYELALDGFSNEVFGDLGNGSPFCYNLFVLDDKTKREHNFTDDIYAVILETDQAGFVAAYPVTFQEYEDNVAQLIEFDHNEWEQDQIEG